MNAIHLISSSPSKDPETSRRHSFAANTWHYLHDFGVTPVTVEDKQLARNSKDIGDSRSLPFLKDLWNWGFEKTIPEPDALIFCNSDICFTQDISYWLADGLRTNDCVYSKRKMVPYKLGKELTKNEVIALEPETFGVDLFAFKWEWWERIRGLYPDYIISCEQWDATLLNLCYITCPNPEIKDITYHENHDSFWLQPENRFKNPGQLHNLEVGNKVFIKTTLISHLKKIARGGKINEWDIREPVENFMADGGGDWLELFS